MGSLWNRSGIVERYADDLKAAGAKAYFFDGGTTTPMTVYQDGAESAAHAIPVVADAFGRWPDVFVPYTLAYDVQVKTADGVQLTYTQNIPNPDPVELTVTPDPTADVVTGMIHAELVNTTKTGYVRLNGRTMGNAASGATERANADTQSLFVYLWNNLTDALAPVSGGRGGSAAADFGLNKNITLPNCQGTVLVGLDDMGAAAGGAFTGLTFDSGDATTAGSRTGINKLTLDLTQIPAHSHSGTTAVESPVHQHTFTGGTTGNQSVDHHHTIPNHSHDGTTGNINTSLDHTHSEEGFDGGHAGNFGGLGGFTYYGPQVKNTGGSNIGNLSHTHNFSTNTDGGGGDTSNQSASHNHSFSFTTPITSGGHSHTFTTDSKGDGLPFNNLPQAILVTWYIKL